VREAIPADYHMRSEDETEDAMDESKNSMDESQATESDGSDEEVEASVQEDITRFEQSFKNISQRFRLINRIGEGTHTSFRSILCTLLTLSQAPSQPCTKPKTSSTTSTRITGTTCPSRPQQRLHATAHALATSPSRKSTLLRHPCASSTSSNCCTTFATRRTSVRSSPPSAIKIRS
jgi:hypothetical protein